MALSRKDAATDRQSAIVDSDEDGGWISLYRGDDGAIDTRGLNRANTFGKEQFSSVRLFVLSHNENRRMHPASKLQFEKAFLRVRDMDRCLARGKIAAPAISGVQCYRSRWKLALCLSASGRSTLSLPNQHTHKGPLSFSS